MDCVNGQRFSGENLTVCKVGIANHSGIQPKPRSNIKLGTWKLQVYIMKPKEKEFVHGHICCEKMHLAYYS